MHPTGTSSSTILTSADAYLFEAALADTRYFCLSCMRHWNLISVGHVTLFCNCLGACRSPSARLWSTQRILSSPSSGLLAPSTQRSRLNRPRSHTGSLKTLAAMSRSPARMLARTLRQRRFQPKCSGSWLMMLVCFLSFTLSVIHTTRAVLRWLRPILASAQVEPSSVQKPRHHLQGHHPFLSGKSDRHISTQLLATCRKVPQRQRHQGCDHSASVLQRLPAPGNQGRR